MVRSKSTSILKVGGLLLGFGGLLLGSSNAFSAYGYGGDNEPFYNLNMNGYLRTTVGVMLQDNDETKADDKYRMNMAEVTLNLDFDIKTGPLNWKVITRFDKEAQTDYLDDLEERQDAVGLMGNYSGKAHIVKVISWSNMKLPMRSLIGYVSYILMSTSLMTD